MSVRKAKGNDTFDVTAYLLHETSAAYLVSEEDPATTPAHKRNGQWLPKSQVERGERISAGVYQFTMPEWLATQKGFV